VLQIGNTSVWLSGETIVCEASTGDVHGSIRTKHKLMSVIPKSESLYILRTNKGEGYISFHEVENGNFTVELKLPRRFFGVHRFYGGSSKHGVAQTLKLLKSSNK
jgi:hypothetical protein